MKDIFTILAENNVTVPEEAKSAITAAVGENYKTVAEVEKIQRARDNYKTQLETAQDALKGFDRISTHTPHAGCDKSRSGTAIPKAAKKKPII